MNAGRADKIKLGFLLGHVRCYDGRRKSVQLRDDDGINVDTVSSSEGCIMQMQVKEIFLVSKILTRKKGTRRYCGTKKRIPFDNLDYVFKDWPSIVLFEVIGVLYSVTKCPARFPLPLAPWSIFCDDRCIDPGHNGSQIKNCKLQLI